MRPMRIGVTTVALLLTLLGGPLLMGSSGLAQEASPPRPSHIHNGDCDELGEVIQPLNSLTVPSGPVAGNADAVVAEAAFPNLPISFTDLLATDHAVKVHLSKAQIQFYLACGDIGGALDADGALIVGLKELDNSGYTGIAYLVPAANGSTNVSVLIAKVLPGGGIPEAAATPAAGAAETPAASAGPQVVDVGLTEFAIAMPNALPAGPTRFAIHNNGAVTHSFVIEGQGIDKTLANSLQPGQSAFLNVDLAPGSYTIYCPIGEGAHRAKGMEVQLTVT